MTFTLAAQTPPDQRSWNVKVSQIECSSIARAVPDCHQYFTGVAGEIQSYNWPTIQLKATDWTFCIRREEGYCGIEYTQSSPFANPNTFQLDTSARSIDANNNPTNRNVSYTAVHCPRFSENPIQKNPIM